MKYARGFEVNIPFIVFTDYGDEELAEELIKQGVTAFLFDEEWNEERTFNTKLMLQLLKIGRARSN